MLFPLRSLMPLNLFLFEFFNIHQLMDPLLKTMFLENKPLLYILNNHVVIVENLTENIMFDMVLNYFHDDQSGVEA